jgi:hypothetical protein
VRETAGATSTGADIPSTCNTSPPTPLESEEGAATVAAPVGAAADPSTEGLPLVTRLVEALGDRCGDLTRPTSYREARQLEQRLAVLSESYSWEDLVHKAGDLGGVRSVAKVLLYRFNELPNVPGVVVSEESSSAAIAARREEECRRAEAFGRTQARVLLANPGYELEELIAGQYPLGELQDLAMAAARTCLGSVEPAAVT